MTTNRFGLQQHVDGLYSHAPRRMAFDAHSPDELLRWQGSLRQELAARLGIAGRRPPAAARAERLQAVARDGYIEEKYALEVGEGLAAPVYLLIPPGQPPFKPVLVFHGHDPGVQYILGNYPDESTAQRERAVDNNYAQALAQAGYLVCAVEQRGFGERISAQFNPEAGNACRHLAFEYMMQGRTLLGERVWDGMCALTFLLNHPQTAPGGVGCTGNSGGGTTTLFLAALDDRISVAVPASYFCSFKLSILGMEHCECNYVPGLLDLAEMGDLAALIAPRPFRAIAGEHDPIYPIAGGRAQFATVRRAYARFDAEDRCSLAVHPGGHAYNHALSHAWFARWL